MPESRGLPTRLAALGRRRVEGRRVLRWLLVALLVLVPSAAWGVATASAQASLGPHVARYEVTLDHEITVDLGPLGTLVIDSPLPLTLGARVVVQEIPREVTALQGVDTLEALSADLERYVQFFGSPSATLEDAVWALVADAVRRTLLAAGLVAVTVLALRALLGPARRREVARELRPHTAALAGGTALALVVVGTVTASDHRVTVAADDRQASAVFDGTPLEGARITGRLAGVIDTYGGYVVDAVRDNDAFYAAARGNLTAAWEARRASDAALAAIRGERPFGDRRDAEGADARSAPGDAADDAAVEGGTERTGPADAARGATPTPPPARTEPTADPTGEPPGGPTSEPSDEPTGEPTEVPVDVEPASELVTLLVVSDLHCNVGMAPVIGEALQLSGAQVLIDGGDTTVNGTAVESYCVTAFASAVPAGVDVVVASGNHDSTETEDQYRGAGAVVLDGEVVDVAGLRFLGDTDPRATRIGAGTTLRGDETMLEVSARLAEVACEDPDGVDLLLVHDPVMGEETLGRGCAPAQVSGHMHRRVGPSREGEGVRYVSASTAGAALGRPTVGPLSGIAEMTVLRFDPTTRRIVDYRLVRVHPDASVDVGFAVRWPDGPAEPDPPRRPVGPPVARGAVGGPGTPAAVVR
ncbi:metallophosphoesterase [Cellulomonas sp. APG4]|uniref:metallophosphoesterase n=1 Tax=Cellulomonas sp. APG4 TaxID=1538656 RepID=UPI00137977DF|nr:PT domain-containing protein [Cellulomonas sp. APG4]NCT90562.1 metallophosphoesterase [Cellulomonas sp. APG4]